MVNVWLLPGEHHERDHITSRGDHRQAGRLERHERMERVIASHLERFGRRDELSVAWQG